MERVCRLGERMRKRRRVREREREKGQRESTKASKLKKENHLKQTNRKKVYLAASNNVYTQTQRQEKKKKKID